MVSIDKFSDEARFAVSLAFSFLCGFPLFIIVVMFPHLSPCLDIVPSLFFYTLHDDHEQNTCGRNTSCGASFRNRCKFLRSKHSAAFRLGLCGYQFIFNIVGCHGTRAGQNVYHSVDEIGRLLVHAPCRHLLLEMNLTIFIRHLNCRLGMYSHRSLEPNRLCKPIGINQPLIL